VFIADFATKQWAVRTLTGDPAAPIIHGWHLAIVNNTRLGGSVATAGYELPVTAILTTIVAVLVLRVCRPITAIDTSAPTTLGLLVGSGAANLADALIPPHGVVDFIAFTGSGGNTMSFNLADMALVVGLALCARMIWRIAEAMRGKIDPTARRAGAARIHNSGTLPMRDRLLLSAGHAMLAMCGFIWLYSMAIALTPDAGRSAPNSLLCGLGVFGVVFAASQFRQRLADRRLGLRAPQRGFERVVLDGSVATLPFADAPATTPRPIPRRDVVREDEQRQPDHPDIA
jgi:lipoprotein signal peptidase